MAARNMAELEAEIMKQLQSAMTKAEKQSKTKMDLELKRFYSQGDPKRYKRTGALGRTARTTSPSRNGNSVSFDAYLDDSHNYTTGSWTMAQVLSAAEVGAGGILGMPGFWERSEEEIEKSLESSLGAVFEKA